MEISGIPANVTTNYTESGDSTVSAAMQSSLLKIEEYTRDGLDTSKSSLDYLSKIHKLLDEPQNRTSSTSNSTDQTALLNNTLALQSLHSLISAKEFKLELRGSGFSYFNQLLNSMTNDATIQGIDKFTRVFQAAVKNLAMLDKYAARLDTLSASLLGSTASFMKIGKGLVMLSGGLALLGVTIATFMQAITPEDLIVFGAIIFTLRMAGEISEGATWDFAKLSVSIALLGISIWAFTELVDFEMVTDFAGSLIAITGAMWLMSKIAAPIGAQSANMLKASGAIAIMAGSLWLFGKVVATFKKIDAENTFNIGIALGGFALVYEVIGSMGLPVIAQGALAAAAIGGSLWILAKGLEDINKVKMSFGRGMEIIAMMTGAAGVIALIGNPFTAPFITIGAGLTAAIGASLWLLTKGLNNLTKVKVTPEQASSFKTSLIHTIGAIATLGNPMYAIPIAISTPIALALAGSTLGVVGAMIAVSKMPNLQPTHFENFKTGLVHLLDAFSGFITLNSVKALASVPVAVALATSTWLTIKAMNGVANAKILTVEQSTNFKTGVKNLLEAFSAIGVKNGLKAVASTPIMAAILGSTTMARASFWMIDKMKMISQEKGEAFKDSLEYLVDAYADLGFIKMTKATSASGSIAILSAATLTSAMMLRGFQGINLEKDKLTNNIDAFEIFFSGIGEVFENNQSKFKVVADGVKAFSGMTALTRGLAKTIKSFANLTFEEHSIVDGKMVSTGSTRLTQADLTQVGLSIGSLLNALTSPLANIGSQKDSYTIGGFTVTNPFSNQVQTGIKSMARIGSMLKPLTEAVLMFSNNGIDQSKIKTFNWSIASILSTISVSFKTSANEVRKSDLGNLHESISMVYGLNKAVSIQGFQNGVKSFNTYTRDLAQVKSVINDMNMAKLTKLTMMLGHLNELNKTQGLKALITSFKEFIEVFTDYTNTRQREITIQEQRQREIDEIQSAQTNMENGGGYNSNPLVPQRNYNPIVQQATQQPTTTEVAMTSADFNKLYKKFEQMYNDFFVYQKVINVKIN